MPSSLKPVPPNVFLIVDHLQSVLATVDELSQLTVTLPAEVRSDGATPPGTSLRAFVDRARMFELSIISRALQARARARELRHPHPQVKMLLGLFVGGTAPLADAVEELRDPRSGDFDTGDDPVSYLRSRGLIPPERGSLLGLVQLEIGDEFLVARRIALGPLADLVAQFLDTLAVCYDLFRMDATLSEPDGERDERAAPSSADETQITRV